MSGSKPGSNAGPVSSSRDGSGSIPTPGRDSGPAVDFKPDQGGGSVEVPIEKLELCSTGRAGRLRRLRDEEFDLLVIGGGITGAGIARDATLRGFKVALVDKNDFAFGTSSRSSKLAHGGFRYLKSLEFGLVKEAEAERNWLRRDFPNLVRPLPIIAPIFEGEKYTMPLLWLGISLYNLLDGYKNFKKGVLIRDPAKISRYEPELDTKGLKGFGIIWDTNIDDARLTIETIREAVHSGNCVAVNYLKVTGLVHDDGGRCTGARVVDVSNANQATGVDGRDAGGEQDTAMGGEFTINARVVVNATGIWTDELLEKKPPGYPDKVIRPTKGVHVVFKKEDVPVNFGFGITSHIDGRFFFVIDRENFIVIGTTDTDYREDLDTPTCNADDAEYLLSTVRLKFPRAKLSLDRMVGTWAGIRPLAVAKAKKGKEVSESDVSRKHVIIEGEDGMLSICGGKLTTFRVMAEDLMLKHVKPRARSLFPGARINWKRGIARRPFKMSISRVDWQREEAVQWARDSEILDEHQLHHLFQQYGRGGLEIIGMVREDESLAVRVVPSEQTRYAPWILAEVVYTVLHDAPVHLVDILARRFEFQWQVHPSLQPEACRVVARKAGEILGWDDERLELEVKDYLRYLRLNSFFFDGDLS